jgi:hypothetical protein
MKLEKWKRLHFWKTMRAYRTQYSHVLSAYCTENNLRKIAQKKAKSKNG